MNLLHSIKTKIKTATERILPAAALVKISVIQFLEKFKNMFQLDEVEVCRIAESMLKNGYDKAHPIHLWRKSGGYYLIDGHTRLVAAKRAGLAEVWAVVHDFESEEEALRYAMEQQLNRRNLSDSELLEAVARYDELNGGKKTDSTQKGRNNEILAEQLGVSPRQVSKMRTVNRSATNEEKQQIKSGEASLNQVYNRIKGGEGKPQAAKRCKFCDANGMCLRAKEESQ